jgi:hypothetical protein
MDVVCNCAHIPPTMPTCRSEHLIDCPVAVVLALADTERMSAAHEEIGRLTRAGDTDGIVEFLKRDGKQRAEAAYLRSRAGRAPFTTGAQGSESVDSVAPKSGTGATANRPAPGQQEMES